MTIADQYAANMKLRFGGVITRESVIDALTTRVSSGDLTLDVAKQIAVILGRELIEQTRKKDIQLCQQEIASP